MEHYFMPRGSFLWIVFAVCALVSADVWSQEVEVTSLPLLPETEVTEPVAPSKEAPQRPSVESEVPSAKVPTSATPEVAQETAPAAVPETAAPDAQAKDPKDAKTFAELVETCWDLLKRGGFLMWPIGIISILVLAVGLERLFALCACFCIPKSLFDDVDSLVAEDASPRTIYKAVKKYACAGSNVIQSLLFKTGRPMLEVQAEYEDAKNSEANRLFRPVRFLVLAASVTPLIGLLGTVIGMIQAFIEVSNLSEATAIGANRADLLAQGIYVALVTTCAGLIVAIPAAILAHWYEGRISRLFQKLDKKLVYFLSWMESKEGKIRVTPDMLDGKVSANPRPTAKVTKK